MFNRCLRYDSRISFSDQHRTQAAEVLGFFFKCPKIDILMVEPQKKRRDLLIRESMAESASLHLYRAHYDQFFSLIVTKVRIFYCHHILSGYKTGFF